MSSVGAVYVCLCVPANAVSENLQVGMHTACIKLSFTQLPGCARMNIRTNLGLLSLI